MFPLLVLALPVPIGVGCGLASGFPKAAPAVAARHVATQGASKTDFAAPRY